MSAHSRYSQNRTVNKRLLQRLVGQSDISAGDLVYDIGAGEGAISRALLDKGARVIAIENDPELYRRCKEKFIDEDRFELYIDDFLQRDFPPDSSYKVFSNIPFIRTAEIIDRLLFNGNPPEDCYLILQKEAAEKYTGSPAETLVSLFVKPLFWTDIVYYFSRTDFFPVPAVDIVLLQVKKRAHRLVSARDYPLYRDFIVFCREDRNRAVKRMLKELFTYNRLRRLFGLLDIDPDSRPSGLSFRQYLGVFQFFRQHPLKSAVQSISGSEEKLLRRQADRIKLHRTNKRRKIKNAGY